MTDTLKDAPGTSADLAAATEAPADDACCHAHAQHGYSAQKDAYAKRLRRIEGQVRGIARMVDEDVYCIDILTQVSAATKALQAVAMGLVTDHMSHCVVDAARASDEEAQAKVDEVAAAIGRLLR